MGLKKTTRLAGLMGVLALAACSGADIKPANVPDYDAKDQRVRDQFGTITGRDGISLADLGGSSRRDDGATGGGGIGVNAFLWRGSLETLSFMPLASADPFGGLIITDWYQPVETPNERVKVSVLIRDTVLRADGLRVSVYRQARDGRGGWLDAPVDPNTSVELENRILTRARELRIASTTAAN